MKTIYRDLCERIRQWQRTILIYKIFRSLNWIDWFFLYLHLPYDTMSDNSCDLPMLLTYTIGTPPKSRINFFGFFFCDIAIGFNKLLSRSIIQNQVAWDAGHTEMNQFKHFVLKLCVLFFFILEISASAPNCEDAKLNECDECLQAGCQECSLSQ